MLSVDDPDDSPAASNRLADVRAAILAVEAGSAHPTGETPVAPNAKSGWGRFVDRSRFLCGSCDPNLLRENRAFCDHA
jgi:hypothetical protein